MRFRSRLQKACLILLLPVLLTGSKQVGAQALDYSLDQNTLSGAQGSTVSFVALLSNTDAADQLSLDAGNATFNFTADGLTLVNNFGATPLTLNVSGSADDAWTGVLFRVPIGAATPVADYSGSYEISYTDVTTGISTSHSQNFTVTVTAAPAATETPEPGAVGLGLGLMTMLLAAARQRRRLHARRVRL